LKDIPAEKAAGAGDVIKSVQEKIDALKGVKDSTNAEAIKKSLSELSQELQKIGQHMSQPQNSGGDPESNEGKQSSGESPSGEEPKN